MYFNEEHNQIVIDRGDNYIYIGTYKCGEITIDNKKSKSHIRVKCPYCEMEYDVRLDNFKKGGSCNYCCNKYENSFTYYIQVELGEGLNKYWDWKKNTVNPYLISKCKNRSNEKVWIKCTKTDYHDSYEMSPHNFYKGVRCGYCSNRKVHPKDSFGALYPSKAKYWSSNNDKSPFEVAPKSNDEYKFICQECGEEFDRSLGHLNSSNRGVYCADCNTSQLEQETSKILQKYNVKFFPQKSYEELLGLGGKKLSYDFYLPSYNLLIECQGIQHKKWMKGWITKKDFEKQLEHDKRKREYAKQHDIKLLEIWYYDIDNIENILVKKLNLEYDN